MIPIADLHFHTTCSDGKHSPGWVLERLDSARNTLGLGLAVLTDHDGISGFSEFKAGVQSWWTPICASELSCTYEPKKSIGGKTSLELHLLVYGLNPDEPELKGWFQKFRLEREQRFWKICEKLKAAGFKIDAEKIASRHSGVLGRPHVADALVEAGVVQSRMEAFDKYLKEGGRFDVPKWRFPLEQAVEYAQRHGCLTSIAHPGQYGFREGILQEFRDLGVDALEVYHPRHSASDFSFYRERAKTLGFFVSGGSDFHDADHDKLESGIPSLGRTRYPLEEAQRFLEPLLNRKDGV